MWIPDTARIVEVNFDGADDDFNRHTVRFHRVMAYTEDGQPLYGDAEEATIWGDELPRIRAMYEAQWLLHHAPIEAESGPVSERTPRT